MQFFRPLAISAMFALASHAGAAVVHDSEIVGNVIFGTGGNLDGGWSINQFGNYELALRAKVRYDEVNNQPANIFNADGNGNFFHAAGSPPANPTRARWNFEFSVNSNATGNGTNLAVGGISYVLGMDIDPSAGTNFKTLNLLNNYADHSFGNNTTAANGGAEAIDLATMQALAGANNLMQNSWNMDFLDAGVLWPEIFDPNANGVYSFYLEAVGATSGVALGRVEMNVVVGTGVPEPGSLALAGLALAGLAAARRRKA